MRLTSDNLHTFLLDKGFLEAKSIVEGDYTVVQTQSRNVIFKVFRNEAPSLFVKQLNSFDPSSTYILQKDATCLWLIKHEKAFAEVSKFVPEYFGYDPEHQVLVTECIDGAENLDQFRRRNGALKKGIIKKLAEVLSSYHFESKNILDGSKSASFFPHQVPWVLNIIELATDSNLIVQQNSPINSPVIQAVLTNSEFRKLVEPIKSNWQYVSLINGDIKYMNFLVSGEQPEIKIIDWEFADLGDPLWDVAGVLQCFISYFFLLDQVNNTQSSKSDAIVMDDLKPVSKRFEQFWKFYTKPGKISKKRFYRDFKKAVEFCAVRMIQTAFEFNMQMPTIQPVSSKILQSSFVLLNDVDKFCKMIFPKYDR